MPVGLGAGINLGSATAFLYVDASGMRRGLLQAERGMQNFQRKQEAAASAMRKSATADATRGVAVSQRDIANSAAFVSLNAKVARAADNATKALKTAYDERAKIMARNARATKGFTTQLIAEEKKYADLMRERERMQKRLGKIRAQLALPTTDSRRPEGKSRDRLIDEARELRGAAGTIAAVSAKIKSSMTEMVRLRTQIAAVTSASSTAVVAANRREQLSINQLAGALKKQSVEYRKLAASAGPQFEKLADAAERSGRRLIAALQSQAAAQRSLQNVRSRRAGATNDAQIQNLIKQEESLARRVRLTNGQVASARAAQIRSEKNFTQAFTSEAQRRIKAADEEARKVTEAKRREAEAAKQQSDIAVQRGLGALQTGAIAATIAIGGTTRAWVGYEQQLFNVASISTGLLANTEAVKESIDELSVRLGKAPEELAAGLYAIAQAGIQGDSAMKLLTVSAESAVAGMTDVETAAKPIIGVLNAYGEEAYSASKASDILFAAVTDGVFSFEDLSTQLGDNLSTGEALGVSLEEIAAAYVVLTRRSNSLSESTTQINAVMNSFLKPSEALEAAFKRLTGESATLFFRTHDLAEVFAVVNKLFEEDADAAGRLFPNLRAIRGIFGLTAKEAEAFAVELELVEHASDGIGRRTAVLNVQMKAVAFQLAQAKEQGRQAAIALGMQLAPGIVFASKAGAKAAAVMAKLFSILHGAIGIAVGVGASFLIIAAGIAKFVGFLAEGVAGIGVLIKKLRDLYDWLGKSARAMAVMRAFTNPFVLALTAVGVIATLAIKKYRDHSKAVKGVEEAYKELDKTIANLKGSRAFTAEQSTELDEMRKLIEQIGDDSKKLADIWDDTGPTLDASMNEIFTIPTGIDAHGNAIKELTVSYGELQRMFQRLLDKGEIKEVTDAFNSIISTDDLNFDAFKAEFGQLVADLQSARITPDQFKESMIALSKDTTHLTNDFLEQANAVTQLGEALVNTGEFFGTAATKADELRQGMQTLVKSMYAAVGAAVDMTDPLSAVNSLLGNVGESGIQAIARLGNMGKINFTPAVQSAVNLLAAMEASQKRIDALNATIDEHSQKMSEWQGIISLVSETVGTSANSYAELQSMLDRGKISQAEFNDIQRAAIYLNEQSKIGIDNERVAIAKGLPDLARFVAQHESLSQAYQDLDPNVRGAAEALKDQHTQALLLLAVLVKLLEVMNPDAWPAEYTTKFFADIIQADAGAAALLDRYGLIPEELRTVMAIEPDEAIDTLDEVDAAIKVTQEKLDEALRLTHSEGGQGVVDNLKKELSGLTGRKHDIEIGVVGPIPNDIPTIVSGIADAENLGEEAANALADAWTKAFDEMTTSTDETSIAVANAIPELLRASRAVDDFSDPVAYLSKNFSGLDDSIEDVLLAASRVQENGLDFTNAQRGALELSAALKETRARIEKIDESIQNNQDDMSMWEGRIQLVDDTLGDSTDTLSQYQQALNEGRITQQEYNDAIASGEAHEAFAKLKQLRDADLISEKEYQEIEKAGIWLRARAVGGVLDERAEIAKSLPALARYIAHHDTLNGKYEDLSDEQKGFIAAIRDESVQTALATALMLKDLERAGLAAEGSADKFLKAAIAANPALAAVAEDIGLIPKEITVDVSVKLNQEGQAAIDTLDKQIADWAARKAQLEVELQSDPGNERTLQLISLTELAVEKLRRAKARVFIEAATGQAFDDLTALEDVIVRINDQGLIEIEGDTTDAQAAVAALVKLGIDPKILTIIPKMDGDPQDAVDEATKNDPVPTIPATVTPTVGETSVPDVKDQSFKVTADVAPALATMTQFQTDLLVRFTDITVLAGAMGLEIGSTFTEQMAAAIEIGGQIVESAVYRGPVVGLSNTNRVISLYGQSAGLSFDYGIATGMLSGSGTEAIKRAARYVALLAFSTAMLALLSRSPSKKGDYVGRTFTQGFAQGILAEQNMAISAAKQVAAATTDAMQAGTFDVGSMNAAGGMPVARAGLTSANGSSVSNRSSNMSVDLDVNVSGAGDPKETARVVTDEVWQMLHAGFETMEARTRK